MHTFLKTGALSHHTHIYPLGGGSSLFLGENNPFRARVLQLGWSL